jgi:U3 small nucleolar RNA-associated protein 12
LVKPVCNLPLTASTQAITQIQFHPHQPLILLQTSDRNTTILRLRTEEEVAAKRARRKKRDKEKGKKKGESEIVDTEMAEEDSPVKWEERVVEWCVLRANAKVRSFAISPEDIGSGKGGVSILVAQGNNAIKVYSAPTPLGKKSKDTVEPTELHTIDLPGHRQDIRSLCVSSDDQVVCSASNGSVKIWNLRTGVCLRTIEGGYAVCSTFLPGDRHVSLFSMLSDRVLINRLSLEPNQVN